LPTGVGYVLGAGYQAATGLVLAWVVRKTARAGFPMWVAFPMLWCAMEFFRSAGPLPFEWYFLAHSQWQQLWLIQIAEFTGPLGVSFLVVMGAGLLVDWARVKLVGWPKKPVIISSAVVVVMIVGVLGFGWIQVFSEFDPAYGTADVKVGVVQEVFPLSLSVKAARPDEYLDRHIVLTLDLLKDKPDVVFWPETMLPGGLNREATLFDAFAASEAELRCFSKRLFETQGEAIEAIRRFAARVVGTRTMAEYRAAAARVLIHRYLKEDQFAGLSFDIITKLYYFSGNATPERPHGGKILTTTIEGYRTVRTDQDRRKMHLDVVHVFGCLKGRAALMQVLAVVMDCPILCGGSIWKPNPTPLDDSDLWVYHNGVVEFAPRGDGGWSYAKRQLVPFSEYVPGKYSATALWRLVRKAIPATMPQIEPGCNDTPYLLRGDRGIAPALNTELHTPICFEGTFARRVREMILAGDLARKKILINLSNDGWFVYTSRLGSPRQTAEHRLHFAHSVFRAIETRTPVVRVVNTGISGWIDRTGRVRKTVENSGPDSRNDTIAARSEVFHVAPGGQTTTLYLRCGEWFAVAVVGGCGLLAAITFLRSRNKRNLS
jgi:apolipoprotein N-acyltransferase